MMTKDKFVDQDYQDQCEKSYRRMLHQSLKLGQGFSDESVCSHTDNWHAVYVHRAQRDMAMIWCYKNLGEPWSNLEKNSQGIWYSKFGPYKNHYMYLLQSEQDAVALQLTYGSYPHEVYPDNQKRKYL